MAAVVIGGVILLAAALRERLAGRHGNLQKGFIACRFTFWKSHQTFVAGAQFKAPRLDGVSRLPP
jgi:hypothetical protein